MMHLTVVILALFVSLVSCVPPQFPHLHPKLRWETTVSEAKPGIYKDDKFWGAMSALTASLDALDPIMKKYANPPAHLSSPYEFFKDQHAFRQWWVRVPGELKTLEEQLAAYPSTKEYIEWSYKYMYERYDRLRKRAYEYNKFAATYTKILKWVSKNTFVEEAQRVDDQGEGVWWQKKLVKETGAIRAERRNNGDYYDLEVRENINNIRMEVYSDTEGLGHYHD